MSQNDNTASISTWEQIWNRSDATLSAARLDRERRLRRWTQFRDRLAQHFGDRKLRCVELGAGEGDFSVLLAEQGHDVTLVDFSAQGLDRARARFEQLGLTANYVQADLFDYCVEQAGQFDVSMSFGLVEHFSGQKRLDVINAHRRLLASGGIAMISAPHKFCLPYRFRKAYLSLRGWWPYGFEQPFSARELRDMAKHVGFETADTYNTGFAASVDANVLLMLTGKRRGWGDGPDWLNRLCGWDVNLIAQAA